MGGSDLRAALAGLLPRLRRFARALTGTAADADDLVQAAIERALRSADQWRPGTNAASWMFRIMKNLWIDEIRARKAREKLFALEQFTDQAMVDGAGDMEAHLYANHVQRIVSGLPEEQRLAIALVLVEGLSYREAASVLDVPIGTLTSRLARGRAAIEAALARTVETV
jgi:RNA polymerase sigma-70 factor, ECF subfamily